MGADVVNGRAASDAMTFVEASRCRKTSARAIQAVGQGAVGEPISGGAWRMAMGLLCAQREAGSAFAVVSSPFVDHARAFCAETCGICDPRTLGAAIERSDARVESPGSSVRDEADPLPALPPESRRDN
jgi:hypothetical protein